MCAKNNKYNIVKVLNGQLIMNLYILQQYQFYNSIYRNDSCLDILCNISELFDLLGVYVYPNWYDAEVIDLKYYKYFTEILLRSPIKKMPHPNGSQVLLKYNCQVEYRKTKDYKMKNIESKDDMKWSDKLGRYIPKLEEEEIWVVSVLIPNKYILADNVYNIDDIQEKLDTEQETDSELQTDIEAGMEENG